MNLRPTVEEYVAGIRGGDRALLARAVTLVESRLAEDRRHARELLVALEAEIAAASTITQRVGITGVPGVGKSTFIEALGLHLVAAGERVAVLAVDPSSTRSGGSVLGDKTRMPELARDERAFIRPTPAAGALGGVARNTREVMTLFESAGYTVVLVETVGVGQSETMVAELVDFFLVLMLAGAGDELQGIKRGILELADMLVVNKADGDNLARARGTRAELAAVMHLMQAKSSRWSVAVESCSALTGEGVAEVWARVQEHRRALTDSGEWAANRRRQRVQWMWRLVEQGLQDAFRGHPAVRARVREEEDAVTDGTSTPEASAEELLACFVADRGASRDQK